MPFHPSDFFAPRVAFPMFWMGIYPFDRVGSRSDYPDGVTTGPFSWFRKLIMTNQGWKVRVGLDGYYGLAEGGSSVVS